MSFSNKPWSFYSYKWKIPALFWSLVLGVLLIVTERFSVESDTEIWRLIIAFFLQSWLLIAIFSKEKNDDERIKSIRYFALKVSFALLLLSFYFFDVLTNYIQMRLVYLGIYSSYFYIILFYILLWLEPRFIFKERTKKFIVSEKASIIIMTVYTALVCFVLVAFTYFGW